MDKKSKVQEQRANEKRAILVRRYLGSIIKEMALSNPNLVGFFKTYEEYINQVVLEKIEDSTKHINENTELISRNVGNKEIIAEQLRELGVELSFPLEYSLGMGQFKYKGKMRSSFNIYQEFNGSRLTKEMLLDTDNHTIKAKYESTKSHNSTYDKEIEELKKEIAILEKKQKRTFFRSKKQQYIDELAEDNERLNLITTFKRDEESLRKTVETLENLTSEQRRKILKYLEVSESIIAPAKEIDAYKRKMGQLKFSKYYKEVMTQAFDKMVEQKGMNNEDVLKIFEMMKRVETKTNNNAYGNKMLTKKESEVEKYKDIAEGFLKYIYEPEKPLEDQEFLVIRGIIKSKIREQSKPEGEEHE